MQLLIYIKNTKKISEFVFFCETNTNCTVELCLVEFDKQYEVQRHAMHISLNIKMRRCRVHACLDIICFIHTRCVSENF